MKFTAHNIFNKTTGDIETQSRIIGTKKRAISDTHGNFIIGRS